MTDVRWLCALAGTFDMLLSDVRGFLADVFAFIQNGQTMQLWTSVTFWADVRLLSADLGGRLTFDSEKMKMDEDLFPKAANVNMVVITLLDESVQDEPRPEGQKLTEEEMRSIQRQDEQRPGVFA
ncbi:hypothetical protein Droror1_Dr00024014 [Drosera rotundifolia]